MAQTYQQFEEVQVYEGVAERTGKTVDRKTIRGSKTVCRSLSELNRKVRTLGDGHFYLSATVWPENETRLVLTTPWTTMG